MINEAGRSQHRKILAARRKWRKPYSIRCFGVGLFGGYLFLLFKP